VTEAQLREVLERFLERLARTGVPLHPPNLRVAVIEHAHEEST
jgi:hypothetical protein